MFLFPCAAQVSTATCTDMKESLRSPMDQLQKSLDRVLRKTFSGESIVATILTEKLKCVLDGK